MRLTSSREYIFSPVFCSSNVRLLIDFFPSQPVWSPRGTTRFARSGWDDRNSFHPVRQRTKNCCSRSSSLRSATHCLTTTSSAHSTSAPDRFLHFARHAPIRVPSFPQLPDWTEFLQQHGLLGCRTTRVCSTCRRSACEERERCTSSVQTTQGRRRGRRLCLTRDHHGR